VNGVLVLNAKDGGPAAKAGIRGSTRDEYGRCVVESTVVHACC
jgi:S1-C subfamily serine protease